MEEKSKKKPQQKVNPKLGFGAKVISGIAILIGLIGIQGGLIGGAIGGAIGGGFYYIAIRQLAKYKKVDLMVPLTKEEIVKKKKTSNSRVKFWIIFLTVCGVLFVIAILLGRSQE